VTFSALDTSALTLSLIHSLPCSYVHWQLIPGLRNRHNKCTGAKVRDRVGDNEVATSGGSESLSAANGCDWSTEVSDVRQCRLCSALYIRGNLSVEIHHELVKA